MPLVDPTPQRVSACPVHFLWDGRGHGRTFVRSGFLALLVAGGLWAGARTFSLDALVTAAAVVGAVGAAAWLAGQALSRRATA